MNKFNSERFSALVYHENPSNTPHLLDSLHFWLNTLRFRVGLRLGVSGIPKTTNADPRFCL